MESLWRNILDISQSEASPLKSTVQDREIVLPCSQSEMGSETGSHMNMAGCPLFVSVGEMRS